MLNLYISIFYIYNLNTC